MFYRLKILLLLLFSSFIFDHSANSSDLDQPELTSSSSSLRQNTDEEMAPFLNLKNLHYTRKTTDNNGSPISYNVSLVTEHTSSANRVDLLKRCQYPTALKLIDDWERYEYGDRDWGKRSRIVFVDVEVNNTTRRSGEIIQITLVEQINGIKTGLIFDTYIKPKSNTFSPYSSRVHNITLKELQDKPCFEDVANQIRKFIGSSIVIAHNAAFDIRMIRQEYERLASTVPFTIFYKDTRSMLIRGKKRSTQKDSLILSPVKKAPVRHISSKERNEIYSELEKKSKVKKAERRKRRLSLTAARKTSAAKKQKGPGSTSLAFFIESVNVTSDNVFPLSGLVQRDTESNENLKHHDSKFDTLTCSLLFDSFQQKTELKHYKTQKSLFDQIKVPGNENNPNTGNIITLQ